MVTLSQTGPEQPPAAASGIHHCGLHVPDIEAAVSFYVQALGATVCVGPVTLSGAGAALSMDGSPDTSFKLALLRFADGSGVELFQLLGDKRPGWFDDRGIPARLPHLGIRVSDVDATLQAVERHGGKRLWKKPFRMGCLTALYVQDPGGNVLELLDADLSVVAEEIAHATEGSGAKSR